MGRKARTVENFERDLLSVLGNTVGLSWGRGIKPQEKKGTFASLFLYDFDEVSIDRRKQVASAPGAAMDITMMPTEDVKHAGVLTTDEFMKWDILNDASDGGTDGLFQMLPESVGEFKRKAGVLVQIAPSYIGNQPSHSIGQMVRLSPDAIEETMNTKLPRGKDGKPIAMSAPAKMYDMDFLYDTKHPNVLDDANKIFIEQFPRIKRDKDGKVTSRAPSLPNLPEQQNIITDSVWSFESQLPMKAYRKIPKPGGKSYSLPEEPGKLFYEELWQEAPQENWLTQGRICHVCLNMTKPEEGDDYMAIPICQNCNEYYPDGISPAEANISSSIHGKESFVAGGGSGGSAWREQTPTEFGTGHKTNVNWHKDKYKDNE